MKEISSSSRLWWEEKKMCKLGGFWEQVTSGFACDGVTEE